MSATIFAPPEEIKRPKFDFRDIKGSREREDQYVEELKAYCLENGSDDEYVGEIISIPHADGAALYMVASMKPLELIHVEIGDAWDSQFAELLTPKKVKEMIERDRKRAEIFNRK